MPQRGERQRRLMPHIVPSIFRHLDAQCARLSVERGLARQAEGAGDGAVEFVIAAFAVHRATDIAAGHGDFMRPLGEHCASGPGGFDTRGGGRDSRMIVQRLDDLLGRRQVHPLRLKRGGRQQCEKCAGEQGRFHAILPRTATGTACHLTGSARFAPVTT